MDAQPPGGERRLVLVVAALEPPRGTVRRDAPESRTHRFSGWSSMAAAIESCLAEPHRPAG